jgi:hypothetical protein
VSIETVRAAILKGDWKAAAQSARDSLAEGETAEAHGLLRLDCWWLSDIETLFEPRERIEATYHLHDYIDEKRKALERWEGHFTRLRDSPDAEA